MKLSAKSDQELLTMCWRLEQLLIDQHNAQVPGLQASLSLGFKKDWQRRLTQVHRQICDVRSKLYQLPQTLQEPVPWIADREAAHQDTSYDAKLLAHDLLVSRVEPGEDADPIEDLTTVVWQETDPNSRLSLSGTNQVDITGLTQNEDAYIYTDKGAGHFQGNFEHKAAVTVGSTSDTSIMAAFCVTGTTVDDFSGTGDFAGGVVNSVSVPPHVVQFLLVRLVNGIMQDFDPSVANKQLDTFYYTTLTRTGESMSCVFYTDAARTNVDCTLTITDTGATARRYFYAVQSDDIENANGIDGAVKDFDLGEVVFRRRMEGE